MKTQAAVLHEMGMSRPYAVSAPLRIENLELDGPGPGEVLVEVAAAGLCHSDLSVMDGSRPRVMPMVMGHEASGTVRETGAGVRGLVPGDHVVFSFVPHCGHCLPCSEGRPVLCAPGAKANLEGALLSGARRFRDLGERSLHHHLGVSGFSRYTVASAESLIRIDPEFPLQRAALFGCAVLTGVGAVVNAAKVAPGESVAIFGMGGVGLSAVLGARAAGAYPIIAVDRLEAKLEAAKRAGATHVIRADDRDPAEAIKDLTGGGVRYAFEAVGNAKVMEAAYRSTARGGTTIAIGLAHPEQKLALQAVSLVAEEKTIKGCYMGSSVPMRDIPRFIAMNRQGILPVEQLLTGTVSLHELNQAFDKLDRGEAVRQLLVFPP